MFKKKTDRFKEMEKEVEERQRRGGPGKSQADELRAIGKTFEDVSNTFKSINPFWPFGIW